MFSITELLSLFNWFITPMICAFTVIYDLVWIVVIFVNRKKINDHPFTSFFRGLLGQKENRRLFFLLIILSLIILSFSQIMTIYHPDSLNYHLPRILMWYQNKSVAHFATSDTRMIGSPPLKEFVDLWIYSLYGNIHEQLMNLTQWASYVVNIILVYSIAGYLGCERKWRLLSAFVFAATPIAMAEAFTTQNDEFATSFVLAFAVIILEFIKNKDSLKFNKDAVIRYIALIASIGFIYLSKPSGMFAVLVFAAWLVVSCIKRGDKIFTVLKWLACVVAGSIIVVLPEVIRNIMTYGRITDPWQGPGQLALTYDPRLLFLNFLKNIGNNIIHIIWFWLGKVWVYLVYVLAKLLHVNADNELISEFGQEYKLRTIPVYQFDFAPNVILTVFLLVICVIGIIRIILSISKKRKELSFDYSFASVVSALLIFIFVKWEPFSARYIIAYLGLLAPVLGLELQHARGDEPVTGKRKLNLKKFMTYIIIAVGAIDICAVILFQAFYFSKQFPLSDKGRGYYVFSAEASYENQYLALSRELKDCSNIGAVVSGEQWAYVAMKTMRDRSDVVRFVMVNNDSEKYENVSFHPDAIIFLGLIPEECKDGFMYNKSYYDIPQTLSEVISISYRRTE